MVVSCKSIANRFANPLKIDQDIDENVQFQLKPGDIDKFIQFQLKYWVTTPYFNCLIKITIPYFNCLIKITLSGQSFVKALCKSVDLGWWWFNCGGSQWFVVVHGGLIKWLHEVCFSLKWQWFSWFWGCFIVVHSGLWWFMAVFNGSFVVQVGNC